MNKDQYITNSDPNAEWREGPIEAWFKDLEKLISRFDEAGHSGNQEQSHEIEDGILWDFVRFVYERSTEPCLHGMCEALFALQRTTRIKWYS